MSIKAIPNGGTVATGKGVDYMRLASLRGMLRLEMQGMKSRLGPLRPKIAAEFGLKPRAPFRDFIVAVQTKMNELLPIIEKENQSESL